MKTLVLTEDEIRIAAAILRRGEPVAMPTETVYGLAAPIFDVNAVKKIFTMKGRPSDNPLIAHISSLEMAGQIAGSLPLPFFLLADRFWPGPLTLVVPKAREVPREVSGGSDTIGIRMPCHEAALALIEAVGQPLVAPSANISGRPSPTSAKHVLEDFEGNLSALIDGGPCEHGIESTVLSLIGPIPMLLRPGSIEREELEDVLGIEIEEAGSDAPLHSPGMKYRHYAPKAPIEIVFSPEEIQNSFVISKEAIKPYLHRPLNARHLYAHLREADAIGADGISVLLDPISAKNTALMNRLSKAAGK